MRRHTTRLSLLALVLVACSLTACSTAKKAGRAMGIVDPPGPDEVVKGDSPEVIYEKAQRLYAAGRFDEAGDAFETVWRDHKSSPLAADAQFYEAESRYADEKYNKAFERYKAFTDAHPLSSYSPTIQTRLWDMGVWTIYDGQNGFLGVFEFSAEGVEMLEFLVGAFPHGDYADRALIHMANFHMKERQPHSAIANLQDLIDNYPQSEFALEARRGLGDAYRAINRGVAYDGQALRMAAAHYQAYIAAVTKDPERAIEHAADLEEAREHLAAVRESLAQKGIEAADFYLKAGNVDAARNELRSVVRDFPQSAAAAEARRRLGTDEENS